MGWNAPNKKAFKAGEIPGKGRTTSSQAWRLAAVPRRRPKCKEPIFNRTSFLGKLLSRLGLK